MSVLFWQYNLDPEFPLAIIEYAPKEDQDPIHWHNYLEIALCLSGEGKFIFNEKEFPAKKGDVFIFDNFEQHVAHSSKDDPLNLLILIFLPELIAIQGCCQFDFEYLSPFWYNPYLFINRIESNEETATEIALILQDMKKNIKKQNYGYRHVLNAELKLILAKLIYHYKKLDPEHYGDTAYLHVSIFKALDYIQKNFKQNISLTDVADLINMSASRFRHFFKEVTHLSFMEYINILRINVAKKQLLTTSDNVQVIAKDAGFTNITQFYKVFKRLIGKTPAKFRKEPTKSTFLGSLHITPYEIDVL